MRCLAHGLGITLAFAFSTCAPRGRCFYLGIVMVVVMMMTKVIVSYVHQVQSTQWVIVVMFLRYFQNKTRQYMTYI